MDFPISLPGQPHMIHSVEMHTTGEPTRIIYKGFPDLHGTLLSQRAQAKSKHDHIRRQIILEPRGHWDMYGAILRPNTELVESGQAHIGVLFMHNEGFSTMCGHATIALGRFLIDTHDLSIFPKRNELVNDEVTQTTRINLHAPCGIVRITVPTKENGYISDPSRQISFISVPSFATGIQIHVLIPEALRWPQLGSRTSLVVDISYGGTFYCIVPPAELGFPSSLESKNVDISAMNTSTRSLKAAINASSEMQKYLRHPESEELGFLYSVMVVEEGRGVVVEGTVGVETGLCFFADQQVDRSPTGGAVAARVALAYAKGKRGRGERLTYHSFVSNGFKGCGGFVGSVVEEVSLWHGEGREGNQACVRVEVEGMAFYTGASCFVVEEADGIGGEGFSMKGLTG